MAVALRAASGRLRLLPQRVLRRGSRKFAAAEGVKPNTSTAQEAEEGAKWDVYREEEQSAIAPSSMWKVRIDHKFSDKDLARFPVERELFRADTRLKEDALAKPTTNVELDWHTTMIGSLSVLRMGDYFVEPYRDLLVNRLTKSGDLMEHFNIPRLQEMDATKPLHNNAVPEAGAYAKVRLQIYWFALHVWFLHNKQFLTQVDEGIFGSALCALITRRMFEWCWNQIRGWMHEADVPVMSLTDEVQDLQEYIFGFCVALDQAFKDEAPEGTIKALSYADSDLKEGCHGLVTQVKHVLWSNVYSGSCPHDADFLHELTVYTIQQRAMLEGLARGDFFMCNWKWEEFKMKGASAPSE